MAYPPGTAGSGSGSYGFGTGTEVTRGNGKVDYSKPIDTKTKSITYSADTPDLLLDLSASASTTVSKTAQIQAVKIKNDGYVPALAELVYNSYTAEGTIDTDASGLRYVKYLLNPNEEIILPTTRAVIGDAVGEWDGTAVDSAAPNSNEYTDSGADIDTATSGDVASDATVTTIYLEDGHSNYLRAGDLIRLENEILEVLTVIVLFAKSAPVPTVNTSIISFSSLIKSPALRKLECPSSKYIVVTAASEATSPDVAVSISAPLSVYSFELGAVDVTAVPSNSPTASPIIALVVGSIISSLGFSRYFTYLSPLASVSIVPSAVYEL